MIAAFSPRDPGLLSLLEARLSRVLYLARRAGHLRAHSPV